jgi:aspartyl-tRNA(Asn)/glutamyl-tRNA(Gln) amidotransferase subunit A
MSVLSQSPTISEIHSLYASGTTVTEVVEAFFVRIEKSDKQLQAFVRTYKERALKQAADMEELKKLHVLSVLLDKFPLYGIPYILKDNILVSGLPATAQSKILEGYIAAYSSDVYTYLTKAGGILLGHGNMDEFAMGSSTEYSGYGQITRNPRDTSRVTGGSSGGPAAAVAGGLAVFGIGTDTGGSVRQPASFCGIVGLRPTWGLLSRYGIVATSSSLDQPGIFAQTPDDTEVILQALCQPSPHDATNRLASYKSEKSKASYIIGIPQEFYRGLDPSVQTVFDTLITKLQEQHSVVSVSLPTSRYNLATYYLIMAVEASSNFERYDGIRYGVQSQKDLYYGVRGPHFGKEVSRRIMLGTYASSAGYIDQFYAKANQVRDMITQEFETALAQVDIILTPVSPFPAFKIGERVTANPVEMYLADLMTLSPALAGNASISVPVTDVAYQGSMLPVGAQLVANPTREASIFAFLKANPITL